MDGGSKYEGSQSLLESQTAMSSAVGDASVTIATPNAASQNMKPNVSTGDASPARDHDRLVPMTNVIRIMRKALPSHAKISEEAKETVQQCVSEYINFITSEANDRCQLEQRKTVTADDILWAMRKLGFDDYVEPLSLYLRRYREIEGDHRGSIRGDLLTPPLKPSYSQVNSSAMATFYGDVPPLSSPAPSQMAQSPQGVYPDGATRYYLDVYGDGSGAGGSSSSSQGNLMGGEFDPHASSM